MLFFKKKNNVNESKLEIDEALDNADIIPFSDNLKTKSMDELYKLLDEIINEFILKKPTLVNAVERGIEDISLLKKEIYSYIDLNSYGLNNTDKEIIFKQFETYIWGYGPLQELIDDDSISDIKTISEDNIRIKVNGVRKTSSVKFASLESMNQYINYVAVKNNITLSEINSNQKITDTKSSEKYVLRVTISAKFINSVPHHYLTIRKFLKPKYKKTMQDLQDLKMFNTEIKDYLIDAMKCGLSVFIGGKGGSGKSTLINALIEEIPYDKSILAIQESEELGSDKHPDLMVQKVKESKGEGKIQYTLKDLTVSALLLDLDYIIIGEIKGEEAMDMINAIFTGHVGISSLHCNSSMEAPNKLVHYMRYSKYSNDMKDRELYKMLLGLDVLVFLDEFKCLEITEISGFDDLNNKIIYNPVFKYEIKENSNGEVTGTFIKLNDSCKKVKDKMLYRKFKNKDVI